MPSNELVPRQPDDPLSPGAPIAGRPISPSTLPMVVQAGNQVGGDMAGRDINKTYNVPKPQRAAAHMARLIALYKKEISEDASLSRVVEQLNHYVDQTTYDLRDLEEKLKAGGRERQLAEALELKENAAKALMRHQASESAQLIHAMVLANLKTRFMQLVHPNIAQEDHASIDARVCGVIDDTVELLAENPLNLSSEDLRSFIFLLTGNCHIKWD